MPDDRLEFCVLGFDLADKSFFESVKCGSQFGIAGRQNLNREQPCVTRPAHANGYRDNRNVSRHLDGR